jgi:hypothetical protein
MKNAGATIACASADDILTTEKRDLLLNTIIPAALKDLEPLSDRCFSLRALSEAVHGALPHGNLSVVL